MQDSGSAEKDDRPLQASGELRALSNGANNGALNEKDEYSDGSASEGLEGEEGEEDEYSDEEESECSSQHSVAEHNDVMASGAEADEASGANEEAEKEEPPEILSKVSVPEGGDCMCPAPPCDLQEEADKDSGLVLFQYCSAVRVPGFRAGLGLGGEGRPSPPRLR